MCDSTFLFLGVDMNMELDELYMFEALKEADKAEKKDEVPIGCVIVKDGVIIARGHNLREQKQQASAHAEMIAIQKACQKLGSWRLDGCTLYVTLEPCPMCAGAILQSRIERVIYGAKDPKGGCIESCMNMYSHRGFNHYPLTTEGILEEECANRLKQFFQNKRKNKKANTE